MRHSNESTQRISDNFERFNPYAQAAMKLPDDERDYSTLALAFELSQLRYQLSQQKGK